jgi:phosphoribosylaminoimidazole-succinocarboxamide synthase
MEHEQNALQESSVPGYPLRRGKVRDVYDLGDELIIVASDRISAFDWVMPTPIPGKGKLLTQLTQFWLNFLGEENHLLSMDVATFPQEFQAQRAVLQGRSMRVRKTRVVPFECVARGYLVGSGWKEYQESGTVCGQKLPAGLVDGSQLAEPIFTPATKEETGHDVNVPFEVMAKEVGQSVAAELRTRTLAIYRKAADYAATRGIIIADTKLEWGFTPEGKLIVIDEVLTPDSSRFWPADQYQPGRVQPSFDKQYLRNWLEKQGWDKQSPPPALPDDVVKETLAKYTQARDLLLR